MFAENKEFNIIRVFGSILLIYSLKNACVFGLGFSDFMSIVTSRDLIYIISVIFDLLCLLLFFLLSLDLLVNSRIFRRHLIEASSILFLSGISFVPSLFVVLNSWLFQRLRFFGMIDLVLIILGHCIIFYASILLIKIPLPSKRIYLATSIYGVLYALRQILSPFSSIILLLHYPLMIAPYKLTNLTMNILLIMIYSSVSLFFFRLYRENAQIRIKVPIYLNLAVAFYGMYTILAPSGFNIIVVLGFIQGIATLFLSIQLWEYEFNINLRLRKHATRATTS